MTWVLKISHLTRVTEVVRSYFVAMLIFVAIYALFGRLGAKKVFFLGDNNSVSWAKSALLNGANL